MQTQVRTRTDVALTVARYTLATILTLVVQMLVLAIVMALFYPQGPPEPTADATAELGSWEGGDAG